MDGDAVKIKNIGIALKIKERDQKEVWKTEQDQEKFS